MSQRSVNYFAEAGADYHSSGSGEPKPAKCFSGMPGGQQASDAHPGAEDNRPQSRLPGEAPAPEPTAAPEMREIVFDCFRLLPTQRLLLERDQPVRLGSRAFDLLLALLARPGETVSKRQLMALVWPDKFVNDGNLKVHIAALRRALRDGEAGRRYISTVAGRGYCLVAPVTSSLKEASRSAPAVASEGQRNLPALPTPPIGRDDAIRR